MPTPTPISRHLSIVQSPINGYESPCVITPSEESVDPLQNAAPTKTYADIIQRIERRGTAFNEAVVGKERLTSKKQANGCVIAEENGEKGHPIYSFRDRIACFTWTWFTMNMATGGIANILHSIPYHSEWLRICGATIFLLNICLFITNAVSITLRFMWNPGSFYGSFLSPSESLFIPACGVSIGVMFINTCQYGIPKCGPWLQSAMQGIFWMYAATSFLSSSSLYLIIWSTQTFPVHTMTPIWIFPAYPLLLIAPLAGNLIDALPDAEAAARIDAKAIAIGAVSLQGTGFLVSLMIYGAFIYRLMTQKLPREATRPGMFVSVGPSGFTIAGIVLLGTNVVSKIFPDGYLGMKEGPVIIKVLADLAGLWLWGLCIWFFLVSVGAHFQATRLDGSRQFIRFDMTWYSFVFPNTALVSATLTLGRSLDVGAIKVVGTVMAGILVVIWLGVLSLNVKGVLTKKLLWPGRMEKVQGADGIIPPTLNI